jgi:hypothetical protein
VLLSFEFERLSYVSDGLGRDGGDEGFPGKLPDLPIEQRHSEPEVITLIIHRPCLPSRKDGQRVVVEDSLNKNWVRDVKDGREATEGSRKKGPPRFRDSVKSENPLQYIYI